MKKSAEYMMILRNTDWDANLTTEEIAEAIERYHQWIERLSCEGVLGGGRPLLAGGRVIFMENGSATDGPFVETKEVIGGYIVLHAASIEEATEIAKTFPPLGCGATIELRELAIECPVSTRYAAHLRQEGAAVG